MRRGISSEPIWWLPFSGGRMLSALLVPILIVIFGLAVPLGWMPAPSYDHLRPLLDGIVAKVVLVGFVFVCLVHAAHRLRYVLVDLGLHGARGLVAVLFYGGAIAGAVWSALVAFAG